jgi:thioesterase domain-containing protein
LLAARAMAEIEGIFGRRLSLSTLFEGATIEYLARALLAEESAASQSLLIPVQPHGARAPFFFHHGDRDGGGFYCLSLARHLGPDQPFYALKPHGTEGPLTMRTIEEMAADHLRLIRSVRPNGPYVLAGFCHGGLIAFDIARRLVADGEVVAFLGLISPPLLARSTSEFVARRILSALIASTAALAGRDVHAGVHAFVWLCERLSALRQVVRGTVTEPGDHRSISDHARQLEEAYNRAVEGYVPRSYPGRVTVFWPEGKRVGGLGDVTIGWRQVAKHVELHVVPGEHLTSITRHLPALAALLTTCLDTAEAGLGPAIASSRHGSSEIFQQPVFGGMTVAESIRAFGGRNAWLPVRCNRHRSPATPCECLLSGNPGVRAEKVVRRNRP